MALSAKAHELYQILIKEGTKLGDLRTMAKEIRVDFGLASELWDSEQFLPRLMAILIMDKKQLSEDAIDKLLADIEKHPMDQRLQLADWLMANQLSKDKKTIAMMQSWEQHASPLHRRIFWYYQGRLRWTGQIPPDNTEELLSAIEKRMLAENPEVQWAMNFTAGWIGIFDPNYRAQCMAMGEKLGLYKDEIVPRNCSPNYLPKFIETEVEKRLRN